MYPLPPVLAGMLTEGVAWRKGLQALVREHLLCLPQMREAADKDKTWVGRGGGRDILGREYAGLGLSRCLVQCECLIIRSTQATGWQSIQPHSDTQISQGLGVRD